MPKSIFIDPKTLRKKNKITFNDDPNSGSSCTSPGTYNYSLNENQLTFTLVSDDCDGRKRIIIATWTKV